MSNKYKGSEQWHLQENFNGITENAVFPTHLDQEKYKPRTLIDETLEIIDPTPNIHTMFIQFNEKYFWNKLLSVQVRWSSRMTTCAGTCTFHPRNRECIIALSAPLLKLRPRKDLVETLLHEMIHGYLFLTNNDRDRDGHGPEFCKHMNRINRDAGTNITIYHSFHNEVRLYQQHWWRCDGPCQHRPPYFGTVRRAMNRPPGPSDFWYESHQANCGGKFTKIREPDNKSKIKNKKELIKSPEQNNTMDRYTTSSNSTQSSSVLSKINGGINKILDGVTTISGLSSKSNSNGCRCNDNNATKSFPKLGTNANNVYGFGTGGPGSSTSNTQSNDPKVISKSQTKVNFTGIVGGNSTGRSNLLDKYFSSPPKQTQKKSNLIDNNSVQCPICNTNISQDLIHSHIDICLVKGNDNENPPIKRAKLSDTGDKSNNTNPNTLNDNINFYTCPICEKKYTENDLNNHLDECLLKTNHIKSDSTRDKKKINNIQNMNTNNSNSSRNYRECPICMDFFTEDTIQDHVNQCLNDDESKKCDNKPNKNSISHRSVSPTNDKTDSDNIKCPTCYQNIRIADYIVHVETCLASEYAKANSNNDVIVVLDDDVDKPGSSKVINNLNDKYKCLVCDKMISKSIPLNEHLDYCVTITYRDTSTLDSSIPNKTQSINIDDDDDISEDEDDKHLCPICMKMIRDKLMAEHVDDCIKSIH